MTDPGLRALRRVEPPRSPWPGTVARDGAGRTVMLVDAAAAALGPAWAAEPDGHVAAPLDLERRDGGHELVLPYCAQTLVAYLSARRAASPLTAGEAVTVIVSLLRGLRQREALGVRGGGWWLTEEGRPVLVPHEGTDDTREVLDALAPGLPAGLDAVVAELRSEVAAGPPRTGEHRERAVFACGAPEPLAPPSRTPSGPAALGPPPGPPSGDDRRASWYDGLVDGDLADLVSRVTTATWRRLSGRDAGERRASRPPRRRGRGEAEPERRGDGDSERRRRSGRRRRLLVAAVLGAAALGIGLLWPSGEEPRTAAGGAPLGMSPSQDEPPGRPGEPGPGSGAPDRPAAPDDTNGSDNTNGSDGSGPPGPASDGRTGDASIADTAAALLRALAACADDAASCVDAAEDPARALGAALPDGTPRVALLDEFGDVAALRADYDAGARLVVIARDDGRWRIRDIHTVDPPA